MSTTTTTATFTKIGSAWGVKIGYGHEEGDTVTVCRKDGTTSQMRLHGAPADCKGYQVWSATTARTAPTTPRTAAPAPASAAKANGRCRCGARIAAWHDGAAWGLCHDCL